MVKKLIVVAIFISFVWGSVFEKSCVACHKRVHVGLKPIFFNYLLYHSSKKRVIKAMKAYLLHPDPKKRLTPKKFQRKRIFVHHFGSKTLDVALHEYWERYKVIGKIR